MILFRFFCFREFPYSPHTRFVRCRTDNMHKAVVGFFMISRCVLSAS
jgi:hypothetical protein